MSNLSVATLHVFAHNLNTRHVMGVKPLLAAIRA
jgi:hypothetical protein